MKPGERGIKKRKMVQLLLDQPRIDVGCRKALGETAIAGARRRDDQKINALQKDGSSEGKGKTKDNPDFPIKGRGGASEPRPIVAF